MPVQSCPLPLSLVDTVEKQPSQLKSPPPPTGQSWFTALSWREINQLLVICYYLLKYPHNICYFRSQLKRGKHMKVKSSARIFSLQAYLIGSGQSGAVHSMEPDTTWFPPDLILGPLYKPLLNHNERGQPTYTSLPSLIGPFFSHSSRLIPLCLA